MLKTQRTATLTRSIRNPREFTLDPDEPDLREDVLSAISRPELVLSRREIIKYVVTEPGQRSKDVQAVLRLDGVGTLRNTLKTAQNRVRASHREAQTTTKSAKDALMRHLDVDQLSTDALLGAVNERRKLLSLPLLPALGGKTSLDQDLQAGATTTPFNKTSAIRDAQAVLPAMTKATAALVEPVAAILSDIETLVRDPSLFTLLDQRALVEQGLRLVSGVECPLCDHQWETEDDLRAHIAGKMEKTKNAEEIRARVDKNARVMKLSIQALTSTLDIAIPIAKLVDPPTELLLTSWTKDLKDFALRLGGQLQGIVADRSRLESGWANIPDNAEAALEALVAALQAKPDQSATIAAQSFLTIAQERYSSFRIARRREAAAKRSAARAEYAYQAYCDLSERILSDLYQAVEERFSEFYQFINSDDEASFKAEFDHEEGKLDLSVDFYGKGMFPPAAYHSEGHQDGMGVCLYLALMERLLRAEFRFAVLDDVVMSVDSGHRRQFCRLLRKYFPDTQFIITTHDSIWARQMRSEGVVAGSRAIVQFHGWSVDTGPIYEAEKSIWDEIGNDLNRNDIPSAAAHLRRYLEYAASDLADTLRAEIPYRADATYDLGDLWPAVVGCHGDLLAKAAKAAESWKDEEAKVKVAGLKKQRSDALEEYGGDQWMINKAVHFNEWAELSRADFEPVVSASRAVMDQLTCPTCSGWLQVVPPRGPGSQSLRCPCSKISINLTPKT